uniref:Retrotransposon gag domain-containing protein n=1 Tax=Tanacetum cinerariifolium TaxID=118510 RepID=A0A6L2KPM2_TANCI|nr:hypothetical protein [Tanacetum cinerariifolium]
MRELRRKLFKGTDDEDAHEQVRRVLEIADLFHFPSITHDVVILRVFPITLKGPALRWINRLSTGLVITWDLLEKAFIRQYCSPFKTAKKLEIIQNSNKRWMRHCIMLWKGKKMRLVTHGLEGYEFELEHEKEDELVVVVVRVVHELDCMMMVKEVKGGLLEIMERSLDGGLSKILVERLKMILRRELVQLTLTLFGEHLIVEFEGLWFRRDKMRMDDLEWWKRI